MFPASVIVGPLCNVTPKLFAVVKRQYDLLSNQDLFSVDLENEHYSANLRPALETIASIQIKLGKPERVLQDVINSPDFEGLVRSLIACHCQNVADQRELLLAKMMQILLEQDVVSPGADADLLAEALLDVLSISTVELWNRASLQGFLAQDAAVTSVNARVLGSEILSLRTELMEQVTLTPSEYKTHKTFFQKYLSQVGASFKYLIHPSFTDKTSIKFDDLYVPANFVELDGPSPVTLRHGSRGQSIYRTTSSLEPEQMLAISYRTVILGNPGAGKSTFAAMLCHEIWKNPNSRTFGGRNLIPVLIVLRDFAKARKETPCSILEYVELRAKADYQLTAPLGAFHRLFSPAKH